MQNIGELKKKIDYDNRICLNLMENIQNPSDKPDKVNINKSNFNKSTSNKSNWTRNLSAKPSNTRNDPAYSNANNTDILNFSYNPSNDFALMQEMDSNDKPTLKTSASMTVMALKGAGGRL